MSSAHNPLRERRSVERVLARIEPLARHLSLSPSAPRILTISRADYELLKRASRAASDLNIFECKDGALHWSGFTLRADHSS
jgi:hypothetical protein